MRGSQLKLTVKLKFPSPRGVILLTCATTFAECCIKLSSSMPFSSTPMFTQTLHKSPNSLINSGKSAISVAVLASPIANLIRILDSSIEFNMLFKNRRSLLASIKEAVFRYSPKGFVTILIDCTV